MENNEVKVKSNGSLIKKLFVIMGFLLLLLIPLSFIDNIIKERQTYKNDAVKNIETAWASSQTIRVPSLSVKNNGKESDLTLNNLNIEANINTEYRKKGIFKIPVYTAEIKTTGNFLNPGYKDIDGFISFDVSDSKGFIDQPLIKVNGVDYSNSSQNANQIKIKNAPALISFENSYKLKGTDSLKFKLGGKTTKISANGNWQDPSFEGDFLPNKREVSKEGFNAQWSVPEIALSNQSIIGADCGVSFLNPVDNYRMTLRTVKYGSLFLFLTFLSFFIFEITSKSKPVHPFQYGLIGLAMIIFYLLLISMSEFIPFGVSYFAATLMTVALITGYTYFILTKENKTPAKLIALILSLLYLYLYTVLKLQDFSLLLGSFGLFLMTLFIMYITRDVQWYKESE